MMEIKNIRMLIPPFRKAGRSSRAFEFRSIALSPANVTEVFYFALWFYDFLILLNLELSTIK